MTATTRRPITVAAPDWTVGLCAQTDPDLFFADGRGAAAGAKTRKAKKVCASCPIQEQCADWALETRQPAGVWGGLDGDERRQILGDPKTPTEICWEQQDLIQERRAAGMSLRKIALEIGVAHASLSRCLADFDAENSADEMVVAA